jgi:hypothetical protein
MGLKITMESTEELLDLGSGITRVWYGQTDKGDRVVVFVRRVAFAMGTEVNSYGDWVRKMPDSVAIRVEELDDVGAFHFATPVPDAPLDVTPAPAPPANYPHVTPAPLPPDSFAATGPELLPPYLIVGWNPPGDEDTEDHRP